MEHSAESLQDLEVYSLQDGFWLVEFYKQHNKYSVIWQLLKLRVTNFMILEQHCSDCTKDPAEEVNLRHVVRGIS